MIDSTRAPLSPWTRQDWMDQAACHGRTPLFFPPLAERPQARVRREAKARALCETCEVQAPCRTYARVRREYGFWGGESEEARTAAGYSVPNPIGGRRRRGAVPSVAGPAADAHRAAS